MAKNKIEFENVDGKALIFRNFAGKEGRFNKEGERSFCLEVDEETMIRLREMGFNVREKERTSTGEIYRYLPIKINFSSFRPPQINQVTSRGGMSSLDESTIESLDYAEIISASIAINSYDYQNQGRLTAYLQELLVEIEDDSFAARYRADHSSDD